MSKKMRDAFETWHDHPAAHQRYHSAKIFAGHYIREDVQGLWEAWQASWQFRQPEIDTHIAAEERVSSNLQKAESKISILKAALFEAKYALTHPDDGWRNDVVNRALGIINSVITQIKEDWKCIQPCRVAGLTAELAAVQTSSMPVADQGMSEQFRQNVRNETLDQAASIIERQDVDPAFKLRIASSIRAMKQLPNPEKL